MGMAAEVTSLLRLINGGDANEPSAFQIGKPTATMDLLALDSKELDLDLQVPCGWEKRLDLKSGKIYLQRCNSSPTSEYSNKPKQSAKFQDLNLGPPESKQKSPSSSSRPLNLFDDDSASLDLKLQVSVSPPTAYQSVCTLDKVKSALERAEREGGARKRSVSTMTSMSSSSSFRSNSSSSVKDGPVDQEERSLTSSASYAAGCPSCLMYVLVTKGYPKCPRCYCDVPLPVSAKRPRIIDLNISI